MAADVGRGAGWRLAVAGEGALRGALARRAAPAVRRRRWYLSLLRDPFALLGGVLLLLLAAVAVSAPRLAPFDPPLTSDADFFMNRLTFDHLPPFWDKSGNAPFEEGDPSDPFAVFERSLPYDPQYKLGTDSMRRDMLSLLLYGLRFSLPVGLLAVGLVALLGTALGISAGWRGGKWGDLVMRAADVAEAVPSFLAYILFAAVVSGPLTGLLGSVGVNLGAVPFTALVLACVGWAPVARLVRVRVLGLKEVEWVLAERALGVSGERLVLRHVLPHTIGGVLVAASSQLPAMLVADGLLGRMGVGQRPPSDSLGELLFNEFLYTVRAPVYVLMPTVLLILMSLALTALSDGVRRALDPRG